MKAKYVILREDGFTPSWPAWVLGGGDSWSIPALRAYRQEAARNSADPSYLEAIDEMISEMESYQEGRQPTHPDMNVPLTAHPFVAALAKNSSVHQALLVALPAMMLNGLRRRVEDRMRSGLAWILG